jgi:hypothetical protein
MQTYELAREISKMDNEDMQMFIREMMFISESKANTLAFLLESEILDKIDYTMQP